MAIMDGKLELYDATDITMAGGTSLLSTVLDLGIGYDTWGNSKTPDIGEGGDLWLNVKVATTITPTAAYPLLYLYTHTTAVVTSGTELAHKTLEATPTAGNSVWRLKLPAGTISRYLGLNFLASATAVTAGALDAWIGLDSESEVPVK